MALDPDAFEKLQNDVEMIKTRVSSLDRIAVLQNRQVIVDDLKQVIGRAAYLAAVLHLTSQEISRQDLASVLGTDSTNINKFTNPFLGNKGYLNEFRRAGRIYYRRDEKMDLIDFDNTEPFKTLIEQWQANRQNRQ